MITATYTIRLVDACHVPIATVEVREEGGHFGGAIDLHRTPAPVRALFEEFEEIVNGQMFSVLEEVQERIRALQLKARFDDGLEVDLMDLQVFPASGDVSFRLADAPAARTSRD